MQIWLSTNHHLMVVSNVNFTQKRQKAVFLIKNIFIDLKILDEWNRLFESPISNSNIEWMTSQFKPTRSLIIPKFQTWPLQKILKKNSSFFPRWKIIFFERENFLFFWQMGNSIWRNRKIAPGMGLWVFLMWWQ